MNGENLFMKLFKIRLPVVIILILGCLVFSRFIYKIFPGLLISMGFAFLPSPLKPVITYGEFPFRLVYELNDERIIIEDTIVCEYDGINMDAGQGKYRKWKAKFSSNGKEVTYLGIVLLEDDEKTIYMYVGSPDYYMGDWMNLRLDTPEINDFKNVITMIPSEGYGDIIDEKNLLEKYSINIIEWAHASPIVNDFK